MLNDEALARKRLDACLAHMNAENAHDFPRCIAAFQHLRYEVVPTGDVYDGGSGVGTLLQDNITAFPDFHFDVALIHQAAEAIVVEGTFRGTHEGTWRGLPATGRKVEVHHMVIAGFIVYALMAEVLRQLADAPDLRERCAAEVEAHAPTGPLTLEALAMMPTSTNVILETKRFVPLVPLAFGRARRAFSCGGYRVPNDWTVYLALWLNNREGAIFDDPHRFDPDRFAPSRLEQHRHALAYIPQGAEPPTSHRCLGVEYSTVLGMAFLVLLLRGHDWTLPPQDFTYDCSRLPPAPRSGMRVQLRAR